MSISPWQGGTLIPGLFELLHAYDINTDQPRARIASDCEKRWIAHDRERNEQDEVDTPIPDETFWALIKKAGLWDPTNSRRQHYDYALILGGTIGPQRKRLAHLAAQWENGVRFGTIVNLAGDRPLETAGREAEKALLNPGTDALPIKPDWRLGNKPWEYEWDMMTAIISQSILPNGMEDVPVVTTRSLKSTGFRAHTGDTITSWLETDPAPGRALMITIQPHVHQDPQVRCLLPDSFELETIAAGATQTSRKRIYFLGAIARWLKFDDLLDSSK